MTDQETLDRITRREAIRRVSLIFGGVAFVGGASLLAACERGSSLGTATAFTPEDVAFLDEVAETILPETKTPGAKAAKTGAFMALMVTDSYSPADQKIFREGMRTLDDACQKKNGASFMTATAAQRLAVLQELDADQKKHSDARETARRSDAFLPDQRKENSATADASGAAAITKDTPAHYFRMMKELALLGYFTSEIGCNKALRYVEAPGRYDPCVPYTAGEPAWAGHA